MREFRRRRFALFVFSALIVAMGSFAFAGGNAASEVGRTGAGNHPGPLAGLIYVLDSNNHRVQIFDRKGVYQSTFGHSFDSPSGIALYARSKVYVKDGNNNCEAEEFDSQGKYLLQFGICAHGVTGLGIFDNIGALAVAGPDVWVSSPDFYYIQKVDSLGNFLGIVCMNAGVTDCPPATAFPVQPYGIALDRNGSIFVTNVYPSGYNVVKFDQRGNFLSAFGSTGSGDGQFNYPVGIGIDPSGNIYVVDTGNSRVQKFDQNGTYQSQFGSFGSGDGQFNFPTGIAFDTAGGIYITDTGNNRVQKFDHSGIYQNQFGSYGQGNGQFFGPTGIAITK